ncbi:MAG: septum formation protein Maf [Actinobacteria bacterium]|nr:septum formation protein Maf [Actinomycetota bacterium]
MRHLVLASASPRRRELIAAHAARWEIDRLDLVPADLDETPLPDETPVDHVHRLAISKATTVAEAHPGVVVLGGDTTVDLGGRILGKPVDDHDAVRMLSDLSGRTHHVHSAVAVIRPDAPDTPDRPRVRAAVATAAVTFRHLGASEIAGYVATGEPRDKAGAYAIQLGGGAFVASVEGERAAIIGLPEGLTDELLGWAFSGR